MLQRTLTLPLSDGCGRPQRLWQALATDDERASGVTPSSLPLRACARAGTRVCSATTYRSVAWEAVPAGAPANSMALHAVSAGYGVTARDVSPTRRCTTPWLRTHHARGATRVRPGGPVVSPRCWAPSRDAHQGDGGNKQGTSNCGTQPNTTISSITCNHARSGQPLALTLNGTVRGLTYKQEAGGSSPSPPIAQSLQIRRFKARLCRMLRRREQATRHSALGNVRT
jgi:hypothetical protein